MSPSSVTTAPYTEEAEALSCYAQPRQNDHSVLCPVSIVTIVSRHPAVIDHGRTETPPSPSASHHYYKEPTDFFTVGWLTAGDLSIQVNLNDYLDIYCPHYPNKETVGPGQPETLALYLVGEASFQGCVETRGAIKRWECNKPYAPFGPVRFSEKIQRFTPFSLGFEFLPGHHYYYSCK
ncbi:ephrin-A4-like isoform X1 [Lates japonicus]|uniref:Ephrin-A4-like isoform X1 n=1 Tax=Lates japonicus TaxID=270547 RepID=A0AAD3RCS6_LATJO|nr:ephrin-A4-like isoform X1 [Lates japonicus]